MEIISTKRELNTKEAWGYSSGVFGLMLPTSIFSGFTFYYMTYIIGLNALLASIGSTLGMLLIAFLSPVFGWVSDNKKPSKIGKRRPFILVGTPIMAIAFFFMWFFPSSMINAVSNSQNGMNWGVAFYYWIVICIYSIFNAFVWSPYAAMLPEISQVEANRIKIASFQGISMLLGTMIGILFPILLKSSVPENKLIFWMEALAVVVAIFSLITLYITYFTIKEPSQLEWDKDGKKHELTKRNADENEFEDNNTVENKEVNKEKNKVSFIKAFKDMLSPLKDSDFRWWELNTFSYSIGLRIPIIVLLPFLQIVLLIKDQQLMPFLMIVIPFALLGFIIWTKLSVKIGLKKAFISSLLTCAILLACGSVFFFNLSAFLRMIFGIIVVCVVIFSLIALYILPNPIVSKIIDQDIEETIKKNGEFKDENDRYKFSGKFFGVNSMVINLAGALGTLIIGVVLNGRENNPIMLTLLLPITAVIVIIAIFFTKKVRLGEKKNIIKRKIIKKTRKQMKL